MLDTIRGNNMKNKWIWVLNSTNVFTLKSLYVNLSAAPRRILRGSCTCLAPQKVQIFSWKSILGRLPTRSNLSRRGALSVGVTSDCVWCPGIQEAEDHLFCRWN